MLAADVPARPCAANHVSQSQVVVGQSGRHRHHPVRGEAQPQPDISVGGADYRIYTDDNSGLNRYLRSRCYAVRIDTALYLNCRKMRYMRYRFGNWYAPTLIVNRHLFFCAQPLGQIASSSFSSDDTPKLGGDVGNAIQVSGYVADRVYYELDTETGRAEFVGKEYLKKRLARRPDVVEAIEAEPTEAASVLRKYLLMLP